jgi:hypothetical protein
MKRLTIEFFNWYYTSISLVHLNTFIQPALKQKAVSTASDMANNNIL